MARQVYWREISGDLPEDPATWIWTPLRWQRRTSGKWLRSDDRGAGGGRRTGRREHVPRRQINLFDFSATRAPDMTLSLTHPASSKGDDTPHWKMSFSLFALMGDRIVRPCSLSYSYFEFEGDKRTAPLFPFSIALFEWRPWDGIKDHKSPTFWMIGRQPDFTKAYYDYTDLLGHRPGRAALAPEADGLRSRRDRVVRRDAGERKRRGSAGLGADLLCRRRLYAACDPLPRRAERGNALCEPALALGCLAGGVEANQSWTYPDGIFGIPDTGGTPIPVTLSVLSPVADIPSSAIFGGSSISVLGADGNFYSRPTWQPDDTGPWRKIDVSAFAPLFGAEFAVTGDYLFALAGDRSLWAAAVDHSANHAAPTWEKVTSADFAVSRFTVTSLQGSCQIVAATTSGGVRAATSRPGSPTAWFAIDLPGIAPAPGHRWHRPRRDQDRQSFSRPAPTARSIRSTGNPPSIRHPAYPGQRSAERELRRGPPRESQQITGERAGRDLSLRAKTARSSNSNPDQVGSL